MKFSTSNNKFIGILGIILGILCISSILAIDSNKLIIPVTSFFLARYFLIILIINCGVYLITFGILNFVGVLVPYYSERITKYERAKHNLLAIILSLPALLSFFSVILLVSRTLFWKILGSLALVFIAWLLYSNLRILKIQGTKSVKETRSKLNGDIK